MIEIVHPVIVTLRNEVVYVMFLHLSVSHSVHRGGGVPGQVPLPRPGIPPGRYTPQARCTPWAGTPPSKRLLLRTVRILLECILVELTDQSLQNPCMRCWQKTLPIGRTKILFAFIYKQWKLTNKGCFVTITRNGHHQQVQWFEFFTQTEPRNSTSDRGKLITHSGLIWWQVSMSMCHPWNRRIIRISLDADNNTSLLMWNISGWCSKVGAILLPTLLPPSCPLQIKK